MHMNIQLTYNYASSYSVLMKIIVKETDFTEKRLIF